MIYWLRRATQIFAFLVFLALLLQLQPLIDLGLPAQVFPRLSPLMGMTASLAARKLLGQYLLAACLVVVVMVLGRFFCSWACPLGATLDVTDRLLSKLRRAKARRLPEGRRLKYYLLLGLILASVFGVQAAGWFDPLSLAPRSYALVVAPYTDWLAKGTLGYLEGFPAGELLAGPARRGWDFLTFSYQPTWFSFHLIFLVALLAIVLLGLSHRRLWCRAICPLGALLALVSQFALFKRKVNDKCTHCLRCVGACNMNAIGGDGAATRAGECTLCLDCQHVCPTGAISFGPRPAPDQREEVDLSRRGLVLAGVGAVLSAPLLGLNLARRTAKGNPNLIRPPASLPEDQFIARCVRCGQCMRVCRTNGLQPVMLESGLEGMWTPRLVPRIGHCDRDCTLCGHSCPSGAIEPLTLQQKRRVAIGRARLDETLCIPWVGYQRFHPGLSDWKDCNCAVCEEVCPVPTKAIRFNVFVAEVGGERIEIRRPYIVEELCTGCGFCEKVCPVLGRAAVYVQGERGVAEVEEAADILAALPERVGAWRRRGQGSLYVGASRLFEYIDGAGEPYLTYSFKQVAAAYYSAGAEGKVKVDVWEFGGSDDAFGAYTMDRAGGPVEVGWEGALLENYLWLWAGPYYARVEPEPGAELAPDDALAFGKAIAEKLAVGGGAAYPAVIRALPTEGLNRTTTRYFHHSLPLQSIRFTEPALDLEMLGLSGKPEGAYGEYAGDGGPARLLLIRYASAQQAEKAFAALDGFLRSAGTAEAGGGGAMCYNWEGGQWHGAQSRQSVLAAVFGASSKGRAEALLRSAAAQAHFS